MLKEIPFFQNVLFGNTYAAYLSAFFLFVLSTIVLVLLNKFVISRIRVYTQKTPAKLDDYLLSMAEKTILPLLYVGAFYLAVLHLSFPTSVDKTIKTIYVILIFLQLTRLAALAVSLLLKYTWLKKEQSAGRRAETPPTILWIIKTMIWSVGFILLLDNLGFNVSAVVAGLGIGGVAIALAAQTILGDLFNYFVIFFDKPFEEGDFIIIDDYLGEIEKIGIKTTRIRSLGGEQIVFGNSDLTSSRVRNYKRMQRRRILFSVGIVYQTTVEQMKRATQIIQQVIEGIEGTVFDRCHFKNFGDFSLNIETVYFILSNDYNRYMDVQQQINLSVMDAFAKEGIDFAYPTQTLFVNKEG
ncbi:MAG: mechanosensitive ion channel family protein [Candidatus Omnitrophica bacterium]|nr:mechanosensitive ion channel family protein [Candidatus Omnitrophota bacterium]